MWSEHEVVDVPSACHECNGPPHGEKEEGKREDISSLPRVYDRGCEVEVDFDADCPQITNEQIGWNRFEIRERENPSDCNDVVQKVLARKRSRRKSIIVDQRKR